MSTGVGNGFAIPHGKTDAVSEIVAAFGITAEPINYAALDEKPVRLVFLLVGRDNLVGPHIKLLSRISRLLTAVVADLSGDGLTDMTVRAAAL